MTDTSTISPQSESPSNSRLSYQEAIEMLVGVVQQLSLARDLDTVMSIVRVAARELTGADGATFVLRDDEKCFYAEENAISPLWKGKRFPLTSCISGWAMLNGKPAVIEDIYQDERIPLEAYRPTFVKSLAMVPIRAMDPIGAIGNYWAEHHQPTDDEIKILQALADTTAVAMENVRVYSELEQRVQKRTEQLEVANKALRAEIEERQRMEEQVRHLSLTDELTGLHNRRGFQLLAEQELQVARRAGSSAWVMFADVDGLKIVNDSLGHHVGDELISSVATLLKNQFRGSDIIARIGGDEFAVLAILDDGDMSAMETRLQQDLEAFNRISEKPYRLSVTIGAISCEGKSNKSLEELLVMADEAMYQNKRAKRAAELIR